MVIQSYLDETDGPTIDRMLNLNINAVMKNVHGIIPHMKQRGIGDIIITCSVAGHAAIQWEPVYSGSKWAMTCFVQTMRRQLMGDGRTKQDRKENCKVFVQ